MLCSACAGSVFQVSDTATAWVWSVSVSAVCVCPFCHLVSVLIAEVFVCDCDPASLPHYVSSQHSRSPQRERERERERCCHARTLWPEQLLTNTISLLYLTSSASVCIPLSLSRSVFVILFLSPHRETFHWTWILAAVVLWRESVFDLGISKRFVSEVHRSETEGSSTGRFRILMCALFGLWDFKQRHLKLTKELG